MSTYGDEQFIRVSSRKLYFVIQKGGRCEKCGLDLTEHLAAADFHHNEEKEKDFNPSDVFTKSLDKAQKELDKCSLVCSNCHREIHYNRKRFELLKDKIYEKLNSERFFVGRNSWCEDDNIIKEVIELNNNGLFVKTIAKKLGVNRSAVMTILKRNGLEQNVFDKSKDNRLDIPEEELKNYIKQGLCSKQIAEKYNCSKATIFNYAKIYNLTLGKSVQKSKKNLDKFKKMIEEGKTEKEICEYFRFHQSTFSRWQKTLREIV